MCNDVSMQLVGHIGNNCNFVLVTYFILGQVVKNSEVAHLACHIQGETLNPFKPLLFKPVCVPGNCIFCVVLTEGR